jgi:hypothetical protein
MKKSCAEGAPPAMKTRLYYGREEFLCFSTGAFSEEGYYNRILISLRQKVRRKMS